MLLIRTFNKDDRFFFLKKNPELACYFSRIHINKIPENISQKTRLFQW